MKLFLIITLLFLITSSVFCQDEMFSPDLSYSVYSNGKKMRYSFQEFSRIKSVITKDEKSSILFSYDSYLKKVVCSAININNNNFFYIDELKSDQKIRYYIIIGLGLLIPIQEYDNKIEIFYTYSEENGILYYEKFGIEKPDTFLFLDDNIELIDASSFLKSKDKSGRLVEYKPQRLKDRVVINGDEGENHIEYTNYKRCWAEGVDGNGEGESLDLLFKQKTNVIQILNGYVDFGHQDLYKKNSRIKTVRVTSESPAFTKDYVLKDEVQYQPLILPVATGKVRLTIVDVYPGEKYQDTCVSSILAIPTDYEAYKKRQAELKVKYADLFTNLPR